MFLDEKTIEVISGRGGHGIVSFRREALVPNGGPDGGDGGHGADVVLRVNEQYTTLLDMGNQKKYRGKDGVNGGAAKCTGKSGETLFVDVPVGTLVKDENGRILADLTEPGQTWVAARGGKGGLGNQHFATPRNQAPRKAIPGQPGEEKILRLELKLMADVGLVGLPNAGKSSLVNRISSARPKVGDYPFTTLEPILGIVQVDAEQSFVIADIPGIIEGASEGKGLGHTFLRHIERTGVLLFLVDGFADDPWHSYEVLKNELLQFHPEMARKSHMVVLNKADLGIEDAIATFHKNGVKPHVISAVTGEGCKDLVHAMLAKLPGKQTKRGSW